MITKEPIEIVISPDYGLTVDPDWVEIGQGGPIIFKASVGARVYLPERVLEPTGETVAKTKVSGDDFLLFDIAEGQALTFTASADAETKLDYFVSRAYFAELVEGVQVPPVIIIKKVD